MQPSESLQTATSFIQEFCDKATEPKSRGETTVNGRKCVFVCFKRNPRGPRDKIHIAFALYASENYATAVNDRDALTCMLYKHNILCSSIVPRNATRELF